MLIKEIEWNHKMYSIISTKGEKGEQKVHQTSRQYQDDRLKWQDLSSTHQ